MEYLGHLASRLGNLSGCAHGERANPAFWHTVAIAQHALDFLLAHEKRFLVDEADKQQCYIVGSLRCRGQQPLTQRRYWNNNLVVIVVAQITPLAFQQTDNLEWYAVNPYSFTDGICVGEQLVCYCLSDHHHTCRGSNIALGNKAAFRCGDVGHDPIFGGRAGRLGCCATARCDQLDAAPDLWGHCADTGYLTQDSLPIALGQPATIRRTRRTAAAVGLRHDDCHVGPQCSNLLRH